MSTHKLLVFATGSKIIGSGGTGFRNLVEQAKICRLSYGVCGVVSNHENGSIKHIAEELQIPFYHLLAPWSAERYQALAQSTGAEFFALSGWIKPVQGLDCATTFSPRTVFNIHPGPLIPHNGAPKFGGPGMYGIHVHTAVCQAIKDKQINYSAVSMHFLAANGREGYDTGPVFFERRKIFCETEASSPESIGKAINLMEHVYQPHLTDLVVRGEITWDGVNLKSLQYPAGHEIIQWQN
jgi:folate-dependent phosphoribosylglycinamide formyltransferase PurN